MRPAAAAALAFACAAQAARFEFTEVHMAVTVRIVVHAEMALAPVSVLHPPVADVP